MSILNKGREFLKTTFKNLRERLDIEQEWVRLQPYTKYLKVPFYLTVGFFAYPYITYHYKRTKKIILDYYMNKKYDNEVKDDGFPEVITKHLISNVLEDPKMQEQTEKFIRDLTESALVKEAIRELLVDVVKDGKFVNSALDLGKTLVVEASYDKEVQEKLKFLVTKVVTSTEVRHEVTQLIKDVFSSQEATSTLVDLLSKAIDHDRLRKNIIATLKFAFMQFLNNPQTLQQIRIFAYFMIKQFEEDPQIKNLINLMIQRGIGIPQGGYDRLDQHLNFIEKQKMKAEGFE